MNVRELFVGRSERGGVQLLRATASSSVAFAVDFAILVSLVEITGLHYLIAATIGFTVGTTITYVLSIYWVFPRRRLKRFTAEYGVFIGVGVIGIILNDGLLFVFTDLLSVHYMVSRLISASLVFFWNYAARKYLLFR